MFATLSSLPFFREGGAILGSSSLFVEATCLCCDRVGWLRAHDSVPAEASGRHSDRSIARERSTHASWYELANEAGSEIAQQMAQDTTLSYSALEQYLLDTLRYRLRQPVTISELAQSTRLPPGTVRMGLQWLIACGVVECLGEYYQTVG